MTVVLTVHSHGGGSGKSYVAASLAAVLARRGLTVCLVDTDVQAPGLHVLLGLTEADVTDTLADTLLDRCEIESAVYDVTDRLGASPAGRLMLVPGRLDPDLIAQLVGDGYDAGLLDEAIHVLIDRLTPDVLVLDTQAGMTNETMVALAAADAVAILIRADAQDLRGGAVATAMTHLLNCPRTAVVVNMLAAADDADEVRARAARAYGTDVAAVIPYLPEVAELSTGRLLLIDDPDHPLGATILEIGRLLVDESAPDAVGGAGLSPEDYPD